MPRLGANAAIRRYNVRVLTLSAVYAVTLLAGMWGFVHHRLGAPLLWLAAVLPALAIIGVFVAVGRYLVEERDEYLRALTVRQVLWATGFCLSVTTLWGFLENYALVSHVPAFYVAVLWFLGLALGNVANRIGGAA